MHLDPSFCFYDDPSLPDGEDADQHSVILRECHRALWSKPLPSGDLLDLAPDIGGLRVTSPPPLLGARLSSDTIASAHNRYRHRGVDVLWSQIPVLDRVRLDRTFYTIGGFIVFPRHPNSMNQRRGTDGRIDDRFDLTLECIRLFYEGVTTHDLNPLGDVLGADAAFFDLFGAGRSGFAAYVAFFHLDDLVDDGRIAWFDEAPLGARRFDPAPLPTDHDAYVSYLENVASFVQRRGVRMAESLKHVSGTAIPYPPSQQAPS